MTTDGRVAAHLWWAATRRLGLRLAVVVAWLLALGVGPVASSAYAALPASSVGPVAPVAGVAAGATNGVDIVGDRANSSPYDGGGALSSPAPVVIGVPGHVVVGGAAAGADAATVVLRVDPTAAQGSEVPGAMPTWQPSSATTRVPPPTTPLHATVAAKSADEVTNVLIAGPKQLQSKFKHAGDFGVTGNYSKAGASDFNAAIQQHINSAGTQSIRGTYRGDPVTHFVDPQTGLNVISRDGVFVSGWRLNSEQLSNVLRNGSLGGG